MLRLLPREESTARFAALNRRLDDLSREVARRRRTEAELRGQREWLRVTLTSIGDAVIATDAAGRAAFLNPAAEALTGWPQDEALGRPLEEVFPIVHEDTRRPLDNPVARVLREGVVVGLANHTLLLGRDGSARPIADFAAPIRDDDRRILGVVLVFHDVGDQRRLQPELSERAGRLAEADRRKDEFLAMLAHELRNPLAPIFNGLHVLRGPGVDEAARALEMMERQSRHLNRLIEGLLEATRVVRGTVRLRPERLDLGPLVRATAEDRRALLEGAGLSLAVEAPAEAVGVWGDATRLAQVLGNLLDNAARFTDAGGAVEVRLTADAAGGSAVLSVRDTGVGIEPEVLGRLFEVFSQGERGLERPRGGLGLGLVVVKGLVELHGGTVGAASAGPGNGSEFTVRIPLESGARPPQPGPQAGPAPEGSGRRVLVVEDSRDAAASLRLLLELLGYEVRVAYTGPAGVAEGEAWRPEKVVCDIGLPGMDGYEVARRLRQVAGMEGVLLVALTGYGREEDRQRAFEAGFDHHLTKPADPDELRRLLAAGRGPAA